MVIENLGLMVPIFFMVDLINLFDKLEEHESELDLLLEQRLRGLFLG
jgi:hypothetical protein